MAQRDSLKVASDFWSSLSLSSFFKRVVSCGCAERDAKKEKSKQDSPSKKLLNEETTYDQDELDRSWHTEEYIEYHPEDNLYEFTKPLVIKPKERLLMAGMSLRSSVKGKTGKGTAYNDKDDEDDDDDDGESNNPKIARKKIKKEKESKPKEIVSAKSGTRGRNLWQPQEDDTLKKLIKQHGKKWSVISRLMGGTRTGKQIRDRFLNKLDPNINERDWTIEEDRMLVAMWHQYGNKWAEIAKHFEGRTEAMVKNRYYSFVMKRIGPDGNLTYDALEPAESKSQKSVPLRRIPSVISEVMSVQRSASSMTEEGSQPFVEQSIPNRYTYNPTTTYAGRSGAQSDDIFVQNRSSSRSNSNLFGKVPLLPHTDSFGQENEQVPAYYFQRSNSFLSASNRKSNTSELRFELQKSVGNSSRYMEILGLTATNYSSPQVIQEEDAKSDGLPSSDPYGYVEQGNSGNHLQAWKKQQISAPDGQPLEFYSYGDDVMRRFGPQKDDEASNFSEPAMLNDMEIESQLDKLVFMLDSRNPSYSNKHAGSQLELHAEISESDRRNMLKKKQHALEMMIVRTQNEMHTEVPLSFTSLTSNPHETRLHPTAS